MADPCEPLSECKDLDGRLLLHRAVYGPQLAFDPGAASFGGIAFRGAALRPLVHLRFEVRWRATGLCQGLPTSVMGLAPGEVVTVGLRTRSTRSFSSLVRDAAERSVSSSQTDRRTRASSGGGGGLGELISGIAGALDSVPGAAGSAAGQFAGDLGQTLAKLIAAEKKQAEVGKNAAEEAVEEAIELIPKFIGKFGSFLEDAAGAIGGAVAGGVAGAVGAVAGIAGAAGNGVADLVDNVVGGVAGGGPAPGLLGAVQQIAEVIDTVERSESESSLRETTVTTTTETEQTVTRTFGNPYLDRSLQLRFIPVFQRFEVSTRPISGIAGLATVLAEPDEPAATAPATGARGNIMPGISVRATAGASAASARTGVSAALAASASTGAASSLRGAMLSSVQKATQASGAARSVRLDQGLTWDRTSTLGNAVHVPLATADVVSKAWGLKGKVTERLQDALTRLRPDAIARLFPKPVVKVVHVFAGLHVEAVPGSCVLPDIPEHLRVVVPRGTTYTPVPLPPAPVDPEA